MKYGIELINELNERKAAIIADLDRMSNTLDDSFVSVAHNNSQLSEINLKLEILAADGLHDFECLKDAATDEVVSVKIVHGKFGQCFLVKDEFAEKFGRFVGRAQKVSTYAKKGLKLDIITLPAWVKLNFGNGSGMAAAISAHPFVFPSDINYYTGNPA